MRRLLGQKRNEKTLSFDEVAKAEHKVACQQRYASVRADPQKHADLKAKKREWRKAHELRDPEHVRLKRRQNKATRRARVIGAEGKFTIKDVRIIFERQEKKCLYCDRYLGLNLEASEFHADHFIPLAKGGSNHPENIVISCPSCNFSKSDILPWDWKPDKYSKA